MTARRSRTIVVLAGALALFAPVVFTGTQARADMGQALALLLAALGLALALGGAGLPSLGQGAAVGLGAYTSAILQTRHGWDPTVAMIAAVALTGAAGWISARAVVRLRPAFVAVATWLLAWVFVLAVQAFPGLSGGAQGIVIGERRVHTATLGIGIRLTPAVLYELSLFAVGVAVVSLVAVYRRFGPALAAVRDDVGAARAAGIAADGLRTGTLVGAAVLAGAGGALYAQLAGVADPTGYGPLLSVKLLLVVLVGGAGTLAGPAIGLVALTAVSRIADALAHAFGSVGLRLEPLVTGGLLLVVLALGGHGLTPAITGWYRRHRTTTARQTDDDASATRRTGDEPVGVARGARVVARDITVDYGGLRALDAVTIEIEPGTIHAIVGPNGSGKTTLLRILAGSEQPTRGVVTLDAQDVTSFDVPARRRIGVVRTLQRTATAPAITAFDHVVSGAEPARRTGALRSIARTPQSRAEARAVDLASAAALVTTGLADQKHAVAARLDGRERRMLQIARALVGKPRALLLDEPSAGFGDHEIEELVRLLRTLRAAGMTVVLVEHNPRVVAEVADAVTTLDAGCVVN